MFLIDVPLKKEYIFIDFLLVKFIILYFVKEKRHYFVLFVRKIMKAS